MSTLRPNRTPLGGKARAARLSKERLREIGRRAVKTRWARIRVKKTPASGNKIEG